MSSVGVEEFQRHLVDLSGRVADHAARPKTRAHLPKVIAALAADLPTKNAWTLAEHAGEADPHGMQHLLTRAAIDEEAAAADLRAFVADYLADPAVVLVGDGTGNLKKGSATVGVQRECRSSTPVPQAGRRTRRSRSTSATPLAAVTP